MSISYDDNHYTKGTSIHHGHHLNFCWVYCTTVIENKVNCTFYDNILNRFNLISSLVKPVKRNTLSMECDGICPLSALCDSSAAQSPGGCLKSQRKKVKLKVGRTGLVHRWRVMSHQRLYLSLSCANSTRPDPNRSPPQQL